MQTETGEGVGLKSEEAGITRENESAGRVGRAGLAEAMQGLQPECRGDQGWGRVGGAETVKGNGFLSSTDTPTTAAELCWAVVGRKERKGTDSYHGVRAGDN